MTPSELATTIQNTKDRENRRSPGLLRWSDFRFFVEKEKDRRRELVCRGLFADLSLEDLHSALLVIVEKENEEQLAPVPPAPIIPEACPPTPAAKKSPSSKKTARKP